MLAAGMLTAASCSEFDDYNEVPVDALPSGNQTLWTNISQNEQLTDFADLVKRAGFAAELDKPRSYTVWAPVNGSFVKSDYESLDSTDLLTQFVKNHVAEYGHVASGAVDKRIHTLNEKSYTFAGSDGAYTFDALPITTPNQPSVNGVLHLLDGAAHFYPNLYEYLRVGTDIDSLRNHFLNYELTYLDESQSVKGPMVDGVQTYIDSVIVTNNSLLNQLNARLANEDSTYTFIVPNDKAFLDAYERIHSAYNFVATTLVDDVKEYVSDKDTKTKSITVSAAYLSDSLTRRALVRNLVFSNNDAYNQWVVGKGENTDTLRSTTRNKLSNPDEILNASLVGQPLEMSNGIVRVVDSLRYYPWETYLPEINNQAPSTLLTYFPSTVTAETKNMSDTLFQRVLGPDFTETRYRYLEVKANGDRTMPHLFFQLPDVMSATYNFYVVMMPSAWPEFGNEPRPNWLNFELKYCSANNKTATYCFSKAYADSLLTGGKLPNVPTTVNKTTAFTTDPQKTDTLFIGQFKFPVAYNGLGDDYYPTLHVSTPIGTFSAAELAAYSRDMRIGAIILKPVEKDEFDAKQK